MNDREDVLKAIGAQIRTWTIGPDGVSASGDDDTNNLQRVLQAHPELIQAFARRPDPEAEAMRQLMLERINAYPVGGTPASTTGEGATAGNPMRMSVAIERYAKAKVNAGTNTAKTMEAKKRALLGFCNQLPVLETPLEADPRVHEVATYHLAGYLDGIAIRTKRRKPTASDSGDAREASTVVKRVSDLSTFFEYAVSELRAATVNPADGLETRTKELRAVANSQQAHYAPYSNAQLKKIFEPATYLSENRQADYFWAPLIGLHLGSRLGELVTLKTAAFGREEATGVWYFEITPEDAKNDNSVRWLPVPERLIELGFIEYVEHVRELGAIYLFPHQATGSKTWLADPSKNCSRHYGAYLDKISLDDRRLVFHSFRHTVVTALQDDGASLSDSMQIVGHQAMDHALRTGTITAADSRSVHLSTYTHPDMVRMSAEHPMARLKAVLDKGIRPELDYERLKKAARIVLENTRRESKGFRSGWPALREKQTTQMLARLDI